MTNSVHIAAELGPNPAPLVELVWALFKKRGLKTAKLHLLTNARGVAFSHELYQGFGLFKAAYGWSPDLSDLNVVTGSDGRAIDQDMCPEETAAWMDARWDNYQRAFDAAGPEPVVFAIAANRARSVLTTGMYTLLARPQDLCLEVRVDEPRVLGGKAGFYFPDQGGRCQDAHGFIDPSKVHVHLIEHTLPRLRPLLEPEQLGSYAAALQGAQSAVERSRPVRISWCVSKREIRVNDLLVPLTPSQAIWIAALCLERLQGDGWVEGKDLRRFRQVRRLEESAMPPLPNPRSKVFDGLESDAHLLDDTSLRKLKAQARSKLLGFCEWAGLAPLLLLPHKRREGGSSFQRLPVPARLITVLAEGNVPFPGVHSPEG